MKTAQTLQPKLRFPEFTKDWKTEQLSAHADIIKDKAGSTKYRVMSVETGVGLISQLEKFGRDISGQSYKNYTVIQSDDFAYNKSATKSFPEGFIAKYKGEEKGAVPNSIFTCFRLTSEKLVTKYLYFQLLNNLHGKWLRKFITVGARANGALSVNTDDLLNVPIPIPSGSKSLKEQQKIADCLGSLDELLTAHRSKLTALQDHKKGLLQQLFPTEGQTTPNLRFPEFKDEWQKKPLGKIIDYQNGKAHEKEILESGSYIVVNSKYISTEGAVVKKTDSANCLAEFGDILMVLSDIPNGRAIAKCYHVKKNNVYTVNQRICKLTPKKVNGRFLFYVLNKHKYFLDFDDGVKQTNLRKDDVLSCPIALPNNESEQQKIADCLSDLGALITAETESIEALQTHKKGLMQNLFPNP